MKRVSNRQMFAVVCKQGSLSSHMVLPPKSFIIAIGEYIPAVCSLHFELKI